MTRVVSVLVLMMTMAVLAAEKPTAEYVALMRDTAAANTAMRQAIEAKDAARIGREAARLRGLLVDTEKFWAARQAADAVKSAKDGQDAAAAVEAAAAKDEAAAIAAALPAIGASCSSCHAAHRERLADGTYEVK